MLVRFFYGVILAVCICFNAVAQEVDGSDLLLTAEEAQCAPIVSFAKETILVSLANVPMKQYMETVEAEVTSESNFKLLTEITIDAYEVAKSLEPHYRKRAIILGFQRYWRDRCVLTIK